MELLTGIKVVSLAVNLPGPAAARRFCQLGAKVIKIEPPAGDPMNHYSPSWYKELNAGQEIITINLKNSSEWQLLDTTLAGADLLITANRPAALERLGLGWETLHDQYPSLCQIAIVGYPEPFENIPGHDLTYQAKIGLLTPPQLPRTLIADMAGAEKAFGEGMALLWAKEHGRGAGYRNVALSKAADYMAEPWTVGFTAPGTILGGGLAEYNLYETSDGWIAVAALEPHFKKALDKAIGFEVKKPEDLRPVFIEKAAAEWEAWAQKYDIPVVVVQ
jgi:alpha-methylacyl-CoA racemase